MAKSARKITFNQFFAVIVLAVVIIYAGLATTAHIVHSFNETKLAREDYQRVVSDLLIDSLRAPLIQGSFVEAKLRAESAYRIPKVTCVSVAAKDNEVTQCPTSMPAKTFEVKKSIYFDEAKAQTAATVQIFFDNSDIYATVKTKIVAAIALNVVLALLVFAVLYVASIVLKRDLKSIVDAASGVAPKASDSKNKNFEISEFAFLRDQMTAHMAAAQVNAETRAAGEIARQVKHDIRSPLAALNMIVQSISTLAAEKREALLAAIERINSIANDLSERRPVASESTHLESAPAQQLQPHEVNKVLSELVEEKRLQYRERESVVFDLSVHADSPILARVCPSKLKRSLSNVLNNSVEAIEDSGIISVELHDLGNSLSISIVDTGHGIPPERLPELGQQGMTFDKVGGTGLGLYYANKTAQEFGGKLSVNSDGISGTSVTMELPKYAI